MKKKKDLSKIKKVLIILSVIGNVFFALFLIIGIVGTVKQKKQNNDNENTQISRVIKRDGLIDSDSLYSLVGTEWLINEKVYTIPINNDGQYPVNTNKTQRAYIDYYFEGTESVIYDSIRFTGFQNTTYTKGIVGSSAESGTTTIFTSAVGSSYFTMADNTIYGHYRHIYITGGSSAMNVYLIQWFFDNAVLINEEAIDQEPYTFQFAKKFNFNAPFSAASSDIYVISSADAGQSAITVSLELPYFLSNETVYNYIQLTYINGSGTSFQKSDGTIGSVSSSINYYFYFSKMEYWNYTTGKHKVVVERVKSANTSTFTTVPVITNNVNWVNANYQTLLFSNKPSGDALSKISQFNNFDGYSGGFYSSSVQVSGVTGLIQQGFTGLLPLFTIEILPNITIGLLMFLPLIAGIILMIIWLVKR